jgi:hypothetical protein
LRGCAIDVSSVLGREPATYNGRLWVKAKEPRPVVDPAGEPVIVAVPDAARRYQKELG